MDGDAAVSAPMIRHRPYRAAHDAARMPVWQPIDLGAEAARLHRLEWTNHAED